MLMFGGLNRQNFSDCALVSRNSFVPLSVPFSLESRDNKTVEKQTCVGNSIIVQ